MDKLPNLQIKHPKTGNKIYYDLSRFLYNRQYDSNGKLTDRHSISRKMKQGELMPDKLERLSLVIRIKEVMEFRLNSGCSIYTINTELVILQLFFDFFNIRKKRVSLDNLIDSYLDYCEYVFYRSSSSSPQITKGTGFGYANSLSVLFGLVLGRPRHDKLISLTRIKPPRSSKRTVSRQADKQNLEDTHKMGAFLIDMISGLTIENVLGYLPIIIPVREGLVKNNQIVITLRCREKTLCELESNAGLRNDMKSGQPSSNKIIDSYMPVENINGTRRSALIAYRVVAEFIIFIAQTGMNVINACSLNRTEFIYKPSGGNWHVKAFKNRRSGTVMFRIYKSYKPYLINYIKFLDYFCPDSDSLFPCFDRGGNVVANRRLSFFLIRRLLNEYNIPWIKPKVLRKTRANWFLRRSGGDEALTADMMQHVKETLRENYENPSHQRTIYEITRFWNSSDIITKVELKDSLLSGYCSGIPESEINKPSMVVEPNCTNASGCLWCKNQRDIDSFDYVWSICTFRYLKIIEASGIQEREKASVDIVIERLSEKIMWFTRYSDEHAGWVRESELRISEGHYHPDWSNILDFIEGA